LVAAACAEGTRSNLPATVSNTGEVQYGSEVSKEAGAIHSP
jgi:hypothetical protein